VASLTIRKLDDDTKTRLRLSAAAKGVSMEEEARRRLKESLTENGSSKPKLTVESLLQFGVKPDVLFYQKKATDEMWDEVLDSHRR
jgi:antitoxin FitA